MIDQSIVSPFFCEKQILFWHYNESFSNWKKNSLKVGSGRIVEKFEQDTQLTKSLLCMWEYQEMQAFL